MDLKDQEQGQGKPSAGTPPAKDEGESGKLRTYTEEEVESRLRGQGKALKDAQERLAAYEKAEADRKAAELSDKERLVKTASELEETRKRLKEKEEAESAELEEIAKDNEAAIKELAKEDRELVPKELPPKALAKWLQRFRTRVATQKVAVHGGGGRGGNDGNKTAEEQIAEATQRAQARLRGERASK